jgi:PilZ domain-containing protein
MKFGLRLTPLVARTIDSIAERWDNWQHKEDPEEEEGAVHANGSSAPVSDRRPVRKSTLRPTRRQHFRKETNYPVEFALPEGAPRVGICRDLSFHGLQIETIDAAPVDSSVIIFIQLVGIEGTTALSGIVRWSTPYAMGVQLDPFGTEITHAIIRMIADDGA